MSKPIWKIAALAVLLPSTTLASDGLNGANTAWILTATALVLMMTLPGLSLFYGGLVRVKNILSILLQCFAVTCVASLLWLLVGYSMAFSEGNAFVGGFDNILMGAVTEGSMAGDIPESVFAMFQMTFAIITPALIVGGFAERMRFSSMLVFSGLWLLAVYAPITHWVWGGGWLAEMGLLDFAGGTVVHVTAGVAAVVAAMVMGPRHGFPTQPMPPHNMTMTITGAGLLWVGWFGFNVMSAQTLDGISGLVAVNTLMAMAGGTLAALVIGKNDPGFVHNGPLAGLVAVCAGSDLMHPIGALAVGLIAGGLFVYAFIMTQNRWKIDDVLGVWPLHGICGAWGGIAAGIFGLEALGGLGAVSLISQLIGTLLGVSVALIGGLVVYGGVKRFIGLRLTEEDEFNGADLSIHKIGATSFD